MHTCFQSTLRLSALSTQLLMVFVLFVSLGTSSRAQTNEKDPIEEINAAFDALNASLKSLKERGEAMNKSLVRCADYLDGLGASPKQMAGKDLRSIVAVPQKLDYDNWNAMLTLNKPTVTELLLKDSVIRASMLEIKAEVMAISQHVNEVSPQTELINAHVKQLSLAMKDVKKGGNPLLYIQAGQTLLKVKNTLSETKAIGDATRGNLISSATVLRKLVTATSVLPATDPLVAELAQVKPAVLVLPPLVLAPVDLDLIKVAKVDKSEPNVEDTSLPVAPVAPTPLRVVTLVGFWEGEGADGLGKVRLMITPAEVGEVAGFLAIEGTKTRLVLTLKQKTADELIFTEARPDYLYEVELDEEELTLRASQSEKGRLFKVVLLQP